MLLIKTKYVLFHCGNPEPWLSSFHSHLCLPTGQWVWVITIKHEVPILVPESGWCNGYELALKAKWWGIQIDFSPKIWTVNLLQVLYFKYFSSSLLLKNPLLSYLWKTVIQNYQLLQIKYYYIIKVSDLIFFAKTWWISVKSACMRWLEPSYAYVNFFPPVNSVSWWQAAFKREVVFSALIGFSLKGKWRNNWSSTLDPDSPDIRRVRSLANHRSLVFCQKLVSCL